MVHCGQVKERVKANCAVCSRMRDISFYSLSVCQDCHTCPECHTPVNECMQTVSYICVASREALTAIHCKSCGARWASRLELDRAVIHQAHTEAAPICRKCGKDVYHSHTSAWGQKGSDRPCICPDCLECPTCGIEGMFQKREDGDVECVVCGSAWANARAFEASCVIS